MIRITSKQDGFRRAGMAHPSAGRDYPDDFFNKAQMERLRNEPMLIVQEGLPDPEPGKESGKGKKKE
ncbi:MAG: HI1506-related protein [Desulfobacteraceae bacterium]|jgi:hypothetical protein